MATAAYIEKYLQDFVFDDEDEKSYINPNTKNNNYLSNSISGSSNLTSKNMFNVFQKPVPNPQPSIQKLEEMKKIWESYPRVEQPKDLKVKLFPHQLVSVHNMEELEQKRRIKGDNVDFYTDFGILGDIPGYGKSFSIVSLILRDKMQWDITKKHETVNIQTINQCIKSFSKSLQKVRVKPNLLLASSTLVEQWKEYFSFVKKDKLDILEISKRGDFEDLKLEDLNDYDVIIVSSSRYNELMDMFPNVVWKRFIFDEAASTHIAAMRNVNAGFVWFISATYQSLLYQVGNSKSYLGAFFKYFQSDYLKYFVIKNDIDFVKDSFKMPKIVEMTHKCLNPRILNVLSSYIDNETKVMIGAGDIRGAIARLGGGTTNNTSLFDIVTKKQQEKLDQAKFSFEFWKKREETNSSSANKREVEAWEKRVKELEKVIQELSEKYKNILEDDCSICYSPIEDPVLIPCCQNVFCGKCIMSWMEKNKTCPLCRSVVSMKNITYIDTKKNSESDKKIEEKKDDSDKPKQKQEKVLDIVKNGLKNKKNFLIFSSYDESFNIIRRELDLHDIPFVEISGSKATRDSKIKKFKDGKISVVFLNSKFNGAGINLENATDIILYHEMPNDIREQVIGRALRIGREQDLTIHNLVF